MARLSFSQSFVKPAPRVCRPPVHVPPRPTQQPLFDRSMHGQNANVAVRQSDVHGLVIPTTHGHTASTPHQSDTPTTRPYAPSGTQDTNRHVPDVADGGAAHVQPKRLAHECKVNHCHIMTKHVKAVRCGNIGNLCIMVYPPFVLQPCECRADTCAFTAAKKGSKRIHCVKYHPRSAWIGDFDAHFQQSAATCKRRNDSTILGAWALSA